MQYADYIENIHFSVNRFFVFSRNTNVFSAYAEKNVRLDNYFGGDGRTFLWLWCVCLLPDVGWNGKCLNWPFWCQQGGFKGKNEAFFGVLLFNTDELTWSRSQQNT